jgi:hypothetical protein
MRSWLTKAFPSLYNRRTLSARTRFVVLFPGRTGSSHLISCLAQHPAIFVEGEKLVRLGLQEQAAYLRALYESDRSARIRSVGLKTKLKDVASLDDFAAMLRAHDVRIITLLRENRLKLAVSTLNARRIHREHGRWNLVKGEARLPPLDASVDEIVSMLTQVDAAQREVLSFAATLPLPRLDLTYEALLRDHDATIGRVEDFLNVQALRLSGSVEKATNDDLRQSVTAYDELAERLRGSAYAADIAEPAG